MDPITLEFIGRDKCDRPVYRHDGRLYVDTDPRQHVAPKLCTKYGNTFYGEPDTPIDPEIQVSFIPHRVTWGVK